MSVIISNYVCCEIKYIFSDSSNVYTLGIESLGFLMLMETQNFAEVIGHQKIILWQYDWMPIDLQN